MINKYDKDKLMDFFGYFLFNWFFVSLGFIGIFG